MMDAVNDPSIVELWFMTSAQIGKTEILNNVIGYYVDRDPSPILLVLPTLELAEAWSKDRLAPMVRDTRCLNGRIKDARSRDSGNTLLHKTFPGGHITMAGANSAASLASRPIRIVLCDEVDRYPKSAGTEGDPVRLAKKRSNNFWNRRFMAVSTPTIKGSSRIEAGYDSSDRRKYWVPCAHCGVFQILAWKNVRWPEGEPHRAVYVCPHCGAECTDVDKTRMLAGGEWRAEKPFAGIAGFWINELYSPWRTFAEVAVDFVSALADPELMKTFVNTSLGETWEERTKGVDAQALADDAAEYVRGEMPDDVAVLTAGVDTQGDRLAVQVVGWSWREALLPSVIDWYELPGDPALPATWDALLEQLQRGYTHPSGAVLVPRLKAIDSGGHHTQQVYAFARAHRNKGFFASKGASTGTGPIIRGRPSKVDYKVDGKVYKKGAEVWMLYPDTGKSWLYGRLRQDAEKRGIRFASNLDLRYYEQLTAEYWDPKKKRWVNPAGKRNEALDTFCGALAAAHHPLLRLDVMRAEQFARMRGRLKPKEQATPAAPVAKPAPKKEPKFSHTRRKGFARNW